MVEQWRADAASVLGVLADLSPGRERDEAPRGSIPLDWFQWLPLSAVRLMARWWEPLTEARGVGAVLMESLDLAPAPEPVWMAGDMAERLAALDQIRTAWHALRVGWLFLAGRYQPSDGSAHRTIFQPLVSRPVRVRRVAAGSQRGLLPDGDIELTWLVADPHRRAELEQRIETGGGALDGLYEAAVPVALLRRLGRLRRFGLDAAAAAGVPVNEVVPAGAAPSELLEHPVRLVAGLAVYAAADGSSGTSRAGSLEAWARVEPLEPTAFHHLYVPDPRRTPGEDEEPAPTGGLVAMGTKPVSPFPLTPAQRRVVTRSRCEPVTVVSGAPGTGKSHTITAVACDALARGETVLVAARSEATVDALVELFERAPGPSPLVFGSSGRKDALAQQLAAGRIAVAARDEVERTWERLRRTVALRDELFERLAARLRAEQLIEAEPLDLLEARVRWPTLFDPGTELDEIGELLADATHEGGGWMRNRRRRRATEELDEWSGCNDDSERRAFAAAYRDARAARMAGDLLAAGGLTLTGEWDDLAELDRRVRETAARWLSAETHSPSRLDTAALAAVRSLATALRSGRAARRVQLARLPTDLTRALPLWAGTLGDIEDLLPRRPGLFDLVVLDEASSIDQVLAAPALLRGRRAVVVGDPRQLRHVSFQSDEHRDAVLRRHGIAADDATALALDVRRNSAFDVAAGVAPVVVLDEQFRSSPHLIDFVVRRLYDDEVHVATRTPATTDIDCIELICVEGGRDDGGAVRSEVRQVVKVVRRLCARGVHSVGVVTPFRAQADALEEAMLGAFRADELEAMDLRVGTVHGFQGIERDVMILSLGVGDGADSRSWAFVQDPHLFTVMVTRARRWAVIVVAGDPPPGGLLEEYLAVADEPPGPPGAAGVSDEWTADLGADLGAMGVPVTIGYPTGRHLVDLCLGDADAFAGVICSVHPEGPEAHIDRQLALRRAGWRLRDAFPSRWAERRGELLVELSSTPPSRWRG